MRAWPQLEVPTGGTIGGAIGGIAGAMIGHTAGGQIGRTSMALSHSGCIRPFTHWQTHPARNEFESAKSAAELIA